MASTTRKKRPAAKRAASKQPAAKQPAAKQPAGKQPAGKQAAKQPAGKQAAKQPARMQRVETPPARRRGGRNQRQPPKKTSAEPARQEKDARSRARLRREDPVRTRPIRNWSTLFRRPDVRPADVRPPAEQAASTQSKEEEMAETSLNDVVTRSVKLGYDVIEEQIRQGQRVAQQINDQSYGPGAMGSDVWELTQRSLRYYTDLASLWFEMLTSLASGNLNFLNVPFGAPKSREEGSPGAPAAGAPAAGAPAAGAPAVAIEIESSRPTKVNLDLRPHCPDPHNLGVQDLRTVEAEKPPLSDVAFEPGDNGDAPSLRIRVSEEQPPGIYHGVVFDRETGETRGTLCVRIGE